MPPWLTQAEINELCEPLTQHAAQIRYLRREYGLTVRKKGNGEPLVIRTHFEEVMNPRGKTPATSSAQGFNIAALLDFPKKTKPENRTRLP